MGDGERAVEDHQHFPANLAVGRDRQSVAAFGGRENAAAQGRGLGKELLARLLIVGADEKLTKLTADILPDNREVMRICEKLGFTLKHSLDDEVVRAEFAL
jgi:RimJ/RimL family protein N-acetyltransferase